MTPTPRPRAAVALLAALLALPHLACRADPPPPAPATTSAAPAPDAPPPPGDAGPADTADAPIHHTPGTVPSVPLHAPPPHDGGVPGLDAGTPTVTRLAAAAERRMEGVASVSFLSKHGPLAILGGNGVDLIDPEKGTGLSLVTGAAVQAVSLSADGALAAVAEESRVTLWDLRAPALRRVWTEAGSPTAISRDGKLVAAFAGESIVVWNAGTGAEVKRITREAQGWQLTFGAGDRQIVTGSSLGVVAYDIATGARAGGGDARTGGTFALVASNDGRWAAAGAPDGHGLTVFDVHAWGPRQLVTVNACEEHITPFFSSDGRRVFARGGTRWIKGFETGTWKPYASYHARAGEEVDTVADDLSRVAVTRGGADPGVVTVETGAVVKLARPLPEQTSYVMSPDGLLVAGAMDGVARVWSAKTGAVLYEAHR